MVKGVRQHKRDVKQRREERKQPEAVPIPKLEFTYDRGDDVQQKEQFNKGKKLYEYQSKKQKKQLSSSDNVLFQKLINSGTIVDKISAFSLSIKDDPEYALIPLHKLIEIASMNSREKCLKACYTMKDLFVHLILKKGVPLHFDEGNGDETTRYYWHCIRNMLSTYCGLVIKLSQDVLSYVRRQAIIMMVELHASNPQVTQELIPELVNKFGDAEKSLITLLTKKLSTELSRKPALTYAFVKQVYGLMYRPNLGQQAQYYCLNFLNSLNLQVQEQGTLAYLLKVFFIFFKKLIKVPNADAQCAKLYTQILKGINKTIPFGQKFIAQLRELYKENEKQIFTVIGTTDNLKIKIQTIYFVYQIQEQLNEHFYRSLYELLLHPDLEKTKLGELLFDLLFLSIKQDTQIVRQKAFIKRLLQLAMHTSISFTITVLICVQKLSIDLPQLLEPQEQIEGVYDPFKREPLYSNANSITEVNVFLTHFHPKVQDIAKNIIEKTGQISQKVNPLLDYSQSAFLAKFAEKTNRTLNRISNLSKAVIDIEEFQKKYELQRQTDLELKNLNRPKKQDEFSEMDEDEFADQLFEKELDKNDIDVDEDEDIVDCDQSDDDEQPKKQRISVIRRRIERKRRLLKGK